jgi:hypothetical protein
MLRFVLLRRVRDKSSGGVFVDTFTRDAEAPEIERLLRSGGRGNGWYNHCDLLAVEVLDETPSEPDAEAEWPGDGWRDVQEGEMYKPSDEMRDENGRISMLENFLSPMCRRVAGHPPVRRRVTPPISGVTVPTSVTVEHGGISRDYTWDSCAGEWRISQPTEGWTSVLRNHEKP